MSDYDYTHIVGVFRDHEQATQAIDALREAGIGGETVHLTEYTMPEVQQDTDTEIVPAPQSGKKRVLVHVRAEGREKEAVGILTKHGANNADIPVNTELVEGEIVSRDAPEAHP